MGRKIADCRRFESDNNCSLTIIGEEEEEEEEEVIAVAAAHAAQAHGHEDTPELREQLRGLLESEESYIPGSRTPQPFPA